MTYLVLARKWRPRSFETLVGQEHVVRALSHALTTQRLHHAWLFTGTRGVGKTTLSRILAKSLNCETGITPTPCGVCRACTEIDAGRFVDYLELDAASNRGVDEMTQLLEQAVYSPTSGRFKVYMIDEVHMLTGHAFNAMLKTLEEPPPHVKFILATTDPQKIPVTVLSRCLQFNLKQMPPESIVGHLDHVLQDEQMPFETPALRLIGQAARGSMRDALSLTDQAIAYSAGNLTEEAVRGMLGTIDQRHLVRLLDAVALADGPGVVAVADELSLRSLSYAGALADLAVLLSRIALAQRVSGTVPDDDPLVADIARLASTLSPDHVQLFYSVAVHSRAELPLAPDEYAGFVMACLRMLAFTAEPGDTPPPAPSKPPVARAAPLRAPSPVAATSAPARAPAAAAGSSPASVSASAPASVSVPAAVSATAPVVPPGTTGAMGIEASAAPAAPALPMAGRTAVKPDSAVTAAGETTVADTAPAPTSAPARLSPSAAALQAANAAMQRSGPGGSRGSAARPASQTSASKAAPSVPARVATVATPEAAGSTVPDAPDAPAVDPVTNAVSRGSLDQGEPLPVSVPDTTEHAAPVKVAPTPSAPAQPPVKASPPVEAPPPAEASQVSDMDAFEAYASQGPDDDFSGYPGQSPDEAFDDYPTTTKPPATRPGAGRAGASRAAPPARPAVSRPAASSGALTPPASASASSPSGRANPSSNLSATRASPPAGSDRQASSADGHASPRTASASSHSSSASSHSFKSSDQADNFGASAASSAPDTPASPVSPGSNGTITLNEPWASLAARLPLRGLAAQLAQQSEWVTVDGATVVLRVATKTLAEGAGVERLRIVLETHFGLPVRLRFEIGKTGDNTAYAAAVSERQARQEAAEQTIMADPFVRDLLDQFGGKIVPDSIRPVTPEAQQGTPS